MPEIFDSDGHISEPHELWRDYVAAKDRDLVLQVRDDSMYSEEKSWGWNVAPACIPGQFANPDANWDMILPPSYDGSLRPGVLDEEGIDRAVVFPTVYLLLGDIKSAEVAAASCSAYNRWIADYCKDSGGRVDAVGVVPMQDPELARAEAARLRSLGLCGITVRPERYNDRALFDPAFNPLWSLAEGEGLPICIHGSFGTRMKNFATGIYDHNLFLQHMIVHPFGQMAAMMDAIAGGVLDRFPGLRFGFFESGLGWIPYWLNRLDEHFEVMGHLTPELKRKPSEIFAEQCVVSMEGDERGGLTQMIDLGLLDCVLWGSDYPHFDATYPGAYREAKESFDAVDARAHDRVVGANPVRFFGLG